MKLIASIFLFFISVCIQAQEFKFAFVTDTHIGSPNGIAEEDLTRTILDINSLGNIDFVVFTGDITEMGTDEELKKAKEIISKLEKPWYIVPGNHDTGWSESGGVSFIREFGYDKFVFEHEGYKFIGCASGPYVRMSDGHIPRDAIVWLEKVLSQTPKDQRIIFANHYPLDSSLDNWYDAVDRLKEYNIQFAICGHGHRNKNMDFEGIPAAMGRSNLRAKKKVGGYNIVEVKQDKAIFSERSPGGETQEAWREIDLGNRKFDKEIDYERPSYVVNDSFPQVAKQWEFHSDANVISTPLKINDLVIFGNSTGKVQALSAKTGKEKWTYQTLGGVFSSPAGHKNNVILGSGDGSIYCFKSETGDVLWTTKTGHSVLGSPLVNKGKVYVGGSDGKFRKLDANNGKIIWEFDALKGPVVSTPLLYKDLIIFGAWDTFLYALNKDTGNLVWKWTNGSANRMYSPAMVIPVAHNDVIYIVAPDRYLSAIDYHTGKTLWRSNEETVRESLGISWDKKLLFGKTMNDKIVAFKTTKEKAVKAWEKDVKFGYDHVPSMLYEQNGQIIFGTRNGVVYNLNSKTRDVNWKYKIDNSMVNNVRIIGNKQLIVSTMDGKVVLLKW